MNLWVLLNSLQNVDCVVLAGSQSDWVQTASPLLPALGSGSNVNLVFKAFVMPLRVYSMHLLLWDMGSG